LALEVLSLEYETVHANVIVTPEIAASAIEDATLEARYDFKVKSVRFMGQGITPNNESKQWFARREASEHTLKILVG
jgi:NifB/MoaA-like Fe-S oxidoreductase